MCQSLEGNWPWDELAADRCSRHSSYLPDEATLSAEPSKPNSIEVKEKPITEDDQTMATVASTIAEWIASTKSKA